MSRGWVGSDRSTTAARAPPGDKVVDGVPPDELMASLFEAIVMQNLSVLTRGNTLLPVVLLLGGPNCYIKGMRDCWKSNIPKIWEERKFPLPEGVDGAVEPVVHGPEER